MNTFERKNHFEMIEIKYDVNFNQLFLCASLSQPLNLTKDSDYIFKRGLDKIPFSKVLFKTSVFFEIPYFSES